MRLVSTATWGDGDIAAKLLGVYEEELHSAFAELANQTFGAIIDIGAADGFYAVGAARLFPIAKVFAYDVNEQSHAILLKNADLNGVSDRISVGTACIGETLFQLVEKFGRVLVIADCEGGETEVFNDPAVIAALAGSELIIECHDFIRPGITSELVAKFFPTHFLEIVYSGERNPNRFRFLSHLNDADRWMTICENRPALMNWLICRSITRR